MKKLLIASSIATLAFATVAMAASYVFANNLTVGSRGDAVTALQNDLIAAGHNIAAGATGYFGSQTKAAVQAYQTENGIPSTGFVGPLTRAALNGTATVAVSTTCPVGFTCTANVATTPAACPVGMTCTPNNTTTGATVGAITTPGVAGVMSVTQGPLSSSVVNVGALNVPVLAIRVQAQYSDLSVQSLNLDLGNNTAVYNKILSKLYVVDGSNVVASQSLNSSTVIQSGNDYIIGLSGFNIIVPKGTYKDIVIKADLNSSIDSAYLSGGVHYPGYNSTNYNSTNVTGSVVPVSGWVVGLSNANGLRAVDGTGVSLNSGTGFYQSLIINPSLTDNAQANISLDSASPLAASVPVTDTTNNQYLGLPVLIFDVNAQNDSLHFHEAKVNFSTSGIGSLTAAYLYQGSTQVMSSSVTYLSNGNYSADFNNIVDNTNGASIAKDATVPFTVKVDVTGVTSSASPFSVTASTSDTLLTLYNTIDGSVSPSGVANGNQQTIASVGPLFTLSGTPTITKTNITAGGATTTTFQYTASYNVQVQAVGTDVLLDLPGTTYPAFSGALANVYTNGISTNTVTAASGIASYSQPTNTAISGNTFTVSRNSVVTIPVTYSFTVAAPGANTYAVQLQGINWKTNTSTSTATFMAGQTAWRTSAI
jgi:hypothetical protein